MADPTAKGKNHQILDIRGLFEFNYKTKGAVLPNNPKTLALTALSAVRIPRYRRFGVVVLGAGL